MKLQENIISGKSTGWKEEYETSKKSSPLSLGISIVVCA